jgi:hypothetical protein
VGSAIATQLVILPTISPASGFTYKYDSASGAFVRSSTSFGPIYAERAETIGRGKIYFGVSYQRFRFENLDGVDLHTVPAVFGHIPNTGPNQTALPYEADVITTTNNIDLKMDETTLFGTVGITDRIDVSLAVPIRSVRIGASSSAQIVRVSGPTFVPPGSPVAVANPHQFTAAANSLNAIYTANGSASGIGDVTVRVKGNVRQAESLRVALGIDVRTPSGDAQRLLGSGATGVRPFVALSSGSRFSPHLNVGYQWNGSSILAGNVTGTVFGEDANGSVTIQNGPAITSDLPDQLSYTLGFDVGATKNLTLAFDYLGQLLIDSPRIVRSNSITQNIPGGTGSLTLPTITASQATIGLSSAAAGLKYNLFGGLLLTGDILFRLDNKGLRQDITPMIGLSYSFGR